MDPYSIEEEPGWFESLVTWTTGLWAYWTAPEPEKLPFDRSVLRARLELCLTRFKVLRRKNERVVKDGEAELVLLAQAEGALTEVKAAQHFSLLRFLKLVDLLEPHLVLLLNSVDLPPHDMTPLLAVRSVIYAASQTHTIEELFGIRQQLLQKYNPTLAIVKIELIDQDLFNLFNSSLYAIHTLEWLNKIAPGRCWAQKLETALDLQQNQLQSTSPPQNTTYVYKDPISERVIEIQDTPNHSDDEDGGIGGLNDSHNSGPTDSPIPPLHISDFPSIPISPALYPSLSLSDSIEKPLPLYNSAVAN